MVWNADCFRPKHAGLALFLLLSLTAAAAQSPLDARRDSLLLLSRTAPADTARVWALMETGKLYLDSDADTAAYYLTQALALAERSGFERGMAKCRINKSYACNNQGDYRQSIALCQAAIPICERLNMRKELVAAYNNMGNAWDFNGNRWQAVEAFSKVLRVMEGVKLPPHFPIVVNSNIARQYHDLRLFDKALEYSTKSLEMAKAAHDSMQIAFTLESVAAALHGLHQEDKALAYYRQAEPIARALDLQILLANVLGSIGGLMEADNPGEARRLYQEALDIARKSGDNFGIVVQLESLSKLYTRARQFEQAKKCAREALALAQQHRIDDNVASLYLTLSDIAMGQEDIGAYQDYRMQYLNMRDTLASNALVHSIQDLETKYETEKKEQQIGQLEQDRQLQQLRIRQKNALLWGLAALAALFLLIGILAVLVLRNRKRLADQELLIRKQEITQLQQEKQLSIADAMLRGQEDERRRLARDLHDGLGGMLSGVKQALYGLKGGQAIPETTASGLGLVLDDLDRSIAELRHISRNLMPEALVRFGLRDALQDYCDHVRVTTRLEVQFQAFGLEGERLPQQMEVILFRIAQELLNNIVKHAGATTVLVQLLRDEDRVHLTVEDNGKGFEVAQLRRAPGVGWLNIQSRVNYLQGTLDLRSAPGQGTSVSIECQVNPASDPSELPKTEEFAGV